MDADAAPPSDRLVELRRQMVQLLVEMQAHRVEFQVAEQDGRLWDVRQRQHATALLERGARLSARLAALRAQIATVCAGS